MCSPTCITRCIIDEDERFKTLLSKYQQYGHILFNGIKWLLVGPPQVGKTTTKYHLLGDHENAFKKNRSTGLEAPLELTYLDSKTAAVICTQGSSSISTWSPLSVDKLALLLLYCIDDQDEGIESQVQEVPTQHAATGATTRQPTAPKTRSFAALFQKLKSILPRLAQRTALEETDQEVSHDEADVFVKRIYERMSEHKDELSEHLGKATTVYLIDTGGQPEFHDLLPLLLRGPAFYLMFFSLADSLKDRYTIKCSYSSSSNDKHYISAHSIKEVMYQMLTTFAYSSTKEEDKCSIKPQAFVLATHLDKVTPQQVKAIDEELRSTLEFKNGSPQHEMLVDATDRFGTLFVPINNLSDSDCEVEKLREFLTERVAEHCKPVPVPITWLMFHFILRDRYETKKVCTYEESVELATRCGIKTGDVSGVLTYIYRKLGTILYFENVPALSQHVVCNPEVVYKAISSLIFNLYSKFKEDDSARLTGLISHHIFTHHVDTSLLGVDYVIELLKHFRVISVLESSQPGALEYFMPCVLHSSDSEVVTDPHPLIFCFPFTPDLSSCEECQVLPVGLATGLVVHLHSLPPTKFQGKKFIKPWEFSQTRHYKNIYQFNVYKRTMVLVVIKGKHVEVHLKELNDNEAMSGRVCIQVMQDVKAALVALCRLYGYNLDPKLRFYCSNRACSVGPHLVEYDAHSRQFKCSEPKCDMTLFDPDQLQMKWVEVSQS